MKQIKVLLLLWLIFLINGCSYKQADTYKNNDELLTCKKLSTQIADIIDENRYVNENTGIEDTSLVMWIAYIPVGIYNQVRAYGSRDSLDERYERLIQLKRQNGCNITYREKMYAQDKGRFSDNFN